MPAAARWQMHVCQTLFGADCVAAKKTNTRCLALTIGCGLQYAPVMCSANDATTCQDGNSAMCGTDGLCVVRTCP